jgi:hypothetical protein
MSVVVGERSSMSVPLGGKTMHVFTGSLNFPPGGLRGLSLVAERVVIPGSEAFIGHAVIAQVTAALSSVFVNSGVVAVDRVAVTSDPAGLALLVWVVAKDDAVVYAISYQVTAFL